MQNNITEEQKKKLHLRKVAMGEIEGEVTGYASIDKPWLKYFTEEQILEDFPKKTCYENMVFENKNHLNDIVFEYLNTKISYSKLFSNIDRVAQAFAFLGVKKGDIVTICAVSTPEIIYTFYALNKIGAISNMIDVRYSAQAIMDGVNEVKSKYLVTLDICYPRIKDIVDKTELDKIIVISPTESAPLLLKTGSNLINFIKKERIVIPHNKKYIKWNAFLKNGKRTIVKKVEYEENQPIAIVHTGGTTGVPKGVVLSNENLNSATLQIKNSNIHSHRGYKFLNIMPPFIAYGLVLGLNIPISLGWYTIVIPKFDANKFDELLIKYKPNGIIGVPAYWETVMSSNKINSENMSYIKDIVLGGDRTKAEFEKRLEKFLKEHNCDAGVGKGYSMTEASACATFSFKESNKLDSVGSPLTHTTIAAFEPGTTEELKYGQIGEICIKTPTMMQGYYEKIKETREVIIKHKDGLWLHSGDLGYVDEDGVVFIKDRMKRMIIRSGFKVFPSEMENLYLKHIAVEACAVVGIPDLIDVSVPKVHIVLKKEYKNQEEQVKKELEKMFSESVLPPYFEPVEYKFRDSMPLTGIGKVDFVALQNEEIGQSNI